MENSGNKFGRTVDSNEFSNILFLSDATLSTVDCRSFDVHRAILANNSDYFHALFCSMDKGRTEVCIPGVSGECLSEILRYLYTGRFTLTDRNISDLMMAADYLLVDRLFTEIKEAVETKLTTSNSLFLLLDAHMMNCVDVYHQAFRFSEINFDVVLQDHAEILTELPLEVFKEFLSSKSLHVPDERTVWLAIVEWVQKDTQGRLSCVRALLNHLARREIDETLATDIVTHNIVANNSYFNISNSSEIQTNLEMLQSFLETHSSDGFIEHRTPPKLYVFAKHTQLNDIENCQIFATYDEKFDLWRKITDIEFYPDHIISIGHKLYTFHSNHCSYLDLKENNSGAHMTPFNGIYNYYSAVKHERFIYVINNSIGQAEEDIELYGNITGIEVYDHDDNIWRSVEPTCMSDDCKAASISSNIYVFGQATVDWMDQETVDEPTSLFQQYDPEFNSWSLLPSPTRDIYYNFLAVYHEKLFVVNDFQVEVYDTRSSEWGDIPNLPIHFEQPKAIVLNDKLYIYDLPGIFDFGEESEKKSLLWDEAEECWEVLNESSPFKNLHWYRVCELDDVDTIRLISKNRPSTELVSCDFN